MALLGAVLLHEKLTLRQVAGIGIAVVGMGLIIADRADAAAGASSAMLINPKRL